MSKIPYRDRTGRKGVKVPGDAKPTVKAVPEATQRDIGHVSPGQFAAIKTEHPQYREIVLDVLSKFPGGPKPEPVPLAPEVEAVLRDHMERHRDAHRVACAQYESGLAVRHG